MTIDDQEAANEDFDDTLMSAVAISTMQTDTVAMTRPRPRPFRNLKCDFLFGKSVKYATVINYADKDDHDEQPADVDEDAGVGEDDGEEAEGIAACRDDHQSLSPANPNEEEDDNKNENEDEDEDKDVDVDEDEQADFEDDCDDDDGSGWKI